MIKTDYHMHSSFSGDCTTPAENMIEGAILKGLTTICFTEHLDLDFPRESGLDFGLDIEGYQKKNAELKERYRDQIEILFGIELGLQSHLKTAYEEIVNAYPFDFVIGSGHLVRGRDPYVPAVFEEKSEELIYRSYFQEMAENLKIFSNIDTCGHLDYIVRYGPNKNKNYTYEQYQEEIDEVLHILIEKQIALEVNSAGYKYGLGQPHPLPEILKKYREMGGELLTIGSDAHEPRHLAYDFDKVKEVLSDCGFRYYTVFRQRKAVFLPI